MDTQMHFRHSGRYSTGGAMKTLVGAVVSGAIGGAIYGYLSRYNPLVFLNVLGNCFIAAVAGMIIAELAKRGHVRSPNFALFAGFIGGTIGAYFNWVAYLHALSGYKLLILNPIGIFEMQKIMAEMGVWSIKGQTPTGMLLMGIWACEALLFIGFCAGLARNAIKSSEYCETCLQWIRDNLPDSSAKTYKPMTALESADDIAKVQGGDVSPLLKTEKIAAKEPEHYLEITFNRCLKCNGLNVLTVNEVTLVGKKKEKKEKKIVEQLLVGPVEAEALNKAFEATAAEPVSVAAP